MPHELTAVLNTPRVSLRPRPDGGLSVDADWASGPGHPDGRRRLRSGPDGVVEELLAEASRVLAGHPSLVAAWRGIGPKPDPRRRRAGARPDRSRSTGCYVAFTHSGATLGLIAGELLAYEIVRGTAHPMLADYNARRFG